ncbi:hypothetical protein HELRODRAFT_183160 [Helobdella robusta]|uniref:Uncharacterized protein n=1 Tax=Helobdella robusta TaxID=6412 RepID=T1FJ85_HELRO|nr:hypothetical protein HELRODRAFT_183160 [Helobdella robusta]ESO11465.1 hypothetical protein HELRODRAFT_183160 [Helobdella robusta]
MWLVAKNSSLLSPDLMLIILHIALRNLRVLGSIGPRTTIHIGKNSIEGRAFPYFFHFFVRCPGRGQTAFFTCQVYISFGKGARDRKIPRQTSPALQGISVHPSGRLPSCAEMSDGSLRTGIEALEKSQQMAVRMALSNLPNLEGSMCLDVRRKYINLGKLRALRMIVKASWAKRQETRPRANLSSESFWLDAFRTLWDSSAARVKTTT